MRLRESILISAAVADVWPWVADPSLQRNWNPKIVGIDRKKSGPATVGEAFTMTYRLSGSEQQTQAHVIACDPPTRIVFQHHFKREFMDHIVEEAYDVRPAGAGVQVIQSLDFSRAALPWMALSIMWIISRFGASTDQSYLDRLKWLVENHARPVP